MQLRPPHSWGTQVCCAPLNPGGALSGAGGPPALLPPREVPYKAPGGILVCDGHRTASKPECHSDIQPLGQTSQTPLRDGGVMTKGLSWEGQMGETRNPASTCRTPSQGHSACWEEGAFESTQSQRSLVPANLVWTLKFRVLGKPRCRKGRGCRKPGHS